jgi:hypothetical protein
MSALCSLFYLTEERIMFYSRSVVLCLSALSFLVPAVSQAAQIAYTINFVNPGGGGLPTGNFTYDSTTSTFTNFVVNWDGLTFDSTISANNGPTLAGTGCGIPATAAGSFAILSGALSTCPLMRDWNGDNIGGSNIVAFNFGTQNNAATNYAIIFNNPPYKTGTTNADATGTFTITVAGAATPEPGTSLMLGLGLLVTGLFARRQMTRLSGATPAIRPAKPGTPAPSC